MKRLNSELPDVQLFEPTVFRDDRGFFLESWNRRGLAEQGVEADFVQDNHSRSVAGTLRGLHYQLEKPQGKLVRVVRGAVFDVAVDLRRSSETFGQWVGHELSEEKQHLLWIPPGFAHGLYVLSPQVDFLYKCTDYYDAEDERTIFWGDAELGVEWPISAGETPIVSEKDQRGTSFARAETYG